VDAMLRHPDLIAGEGVLHGDDAGAPRARRGEGGAAGVYCGLLRARDGASRSRSRMPRPAAVVAMAAMLAELGLRPQPAHLVSQPIINTRGETVGELRVNGDSRAKRMRDDRSRSVL